MVFSKATAIEKFEAVTGVRLRASAQSLSFPFFLRRHPVGRSLPHVENFDSLPPEDAEFGGKICIRIWHTDDLDRGVQDSGLNPREIERGRDAGVPMVAATAPERMSR
jgi:hypothetical protein